MISFEQAITRIQETDASLCEHRVDVSQLAFDSDSLTAGDRHFQLTTRGLSRLCDRFAHKPKVPADYLTSLPDPLRTGLLRLHLDEGIGHQGSINILSRGSQLVGFARSDLVRLTGRDVLEAVGVGTGGRHEDLQITRLDTRDEALQFDLIVHRASHEVRPGDVVSGGVRVTHSLSEETATRVEGFLYRSLCMNGAVYRECTGLRQTPRTRRLPARHPRARDQQREQIQRLAADAVGALNERFQRLESLTSERVEFDHFATNLLRRSRLSSHRLLPLLQQAHIEEGSEDTAYGLMNAFTRVATHQSELPRTIRDILARLGGMLALGHSRLCPRCWSLIAASN